MPIDFADRRTEPQRSGINYPEAPCYFEGAVKVNEVPQRRTIHAIDEATGATIGTTESDENDYGYYRLDCDYNPENGTMLVMIREDPDDNMIRSHCTPDNSDVSAPTLPAFLPLDM